MKQKILELLPRAGALLAALVVLISCVAVPARAASTSEAVKYYDILDFNMSGTITNGSVVTESFLVADYMALYGETYSWSSWDLLIVGEFEGVTLYGSSGLTSFKETVCSFQFKLSNDWLKNPSIKIKQTNQGVTGRYRITGAYLINTTYTQSYEAYYYVTTDPMSLSQVYNNLYNFQTVWDANIYAGSDTRTIYFTPRAIIPCTTMYFEFEVHDLLPDDFALSVMSLSSGAVATEHFDYDLRLLYTVNQCYRYAVEVTGPFTDYVFVALSYSSSHPQAMISFSKFYVGYNRIVNTNSLLDWIRREVTQIRSYLKDVKEKVASIANGMTQLLNAVANGELGSKPSTNIFDAWNGTISNISGNFQSVVNAVRGISGDVVNGLSSSFNSVTTAISNVTNSITKSISDSIGSISKSISDVADSISTAISDSIGSVMTSVSESFDSLFGAISNISDDLIAGIPTIIDSISDALTPAWQKSIFGLFDFSMITSHTSDAFSSLESGFGFADIFNDPEGGVSWLPNGMAASSDADSPTISFVRGLNGFWSFSGDLVSALPSEVTLTSSFLFIGFLFVGFLKIF